MDRYKLIKQRSQSIVQDTRTNAIVYMGGHAAAARVCNDFNNKEAEKAERTASNFKLVGNQ